MQSTSGPAPGVKDHPPGCKSSKLNLQAQPEQLLSIAPGKLSSNPTYDCKQYPYEDGLGFELETKCEYEHLFSRSQSTYTMSIGMTVCTHPSGPDKTQVRSGAQGLLSPAHAGVFACSTSLPARHASSNKLSILPLPTIITGRFADAAVVSEHFRKV
jgi:hypothetical protein